MSYAPQTRPVPDNASAEKVAMVTGTEAKDASFTATNNGTYRVDPTGKGMLEVSIDPKAHKFTLQDPGLTWTDTDFLRVDFGIDHADFKLAHQNRAFHFIKEGNTWAVHGSSGALLTAGGIT